MYKIINNLPIDFQFASKTNEQLKLYGKWFEENREIRLNYLIEYVKSTTNYEKWNSDYSPESLIMLGKWLSDKIETEKIQEADLIVKRSLIPNYIPINDWDLTIKMRSILVDIGIYFGTVFIQSHKELKWQQFFSRSYKDVDNGHLIIKLNKINLNPIRIMINVGLGLADKTKDENVLFKLYNTWKLYCN